MRARVLCSTFALSAICLFLSTQPAESQKRGFGGGGFPGGKGGGTPGGFTPGGGGFTPGGGGGKSFGGGMMNSDPAKIFDMLSKGRGFFLVSDTRSLRDQLTKYSQEQRITNGQITRDQFLHFYSTKIQGGTTRPGDSKGGSMSPGGGPGGVIPPGMDRNEALAAWAESEFKRRDRNDDSYLNTDEAPGALRDDFAKWDKNSDNLISMNEFRTYFQERFQSGTRGDLDAPSTTVTRIIEDEELDLRPTVFRAGMLPKNLPSWFTDLDTDKDGQVALHEWRSAKKDLEEFRGYDRNDDGLMTPEEVIRHMGIAQATATASPGLSAGGGERPKWEGFGKGEGRPEGKGKGGWGGMKFNRPK